MQITRTFNKLIGVSAATVFELVGQNANGFAIRLENQDPANTMVYKFQSSLDGVTWTDLPLPIGGGGTAITFALLPATNQLINIMQTGRIQMVASGDLQASLSISTFYPSAIDATPLQILG
jgi:hypothetical protein